jgi:hypothetical protein
MPSELGIIPGLTCRTSTLANFAEGSSSAPETNVGKKGKVITLFLE